MEHRRSAAWRGGNQLADQRDRAYARITKELTNGTSFIHVYYQT
jgi:hypothetical protein